MSCDWSRVQRFLREQSSPSAAMNSQVQSRQCICGPPVHSIVSQHAHGSQGFGLCSSARAAQHRSDAPRAAVPLFVNAEALSKPEPS